MYLHFFRSRTNTSIVFERKNQSNLVINYLWIVWGGVAAKVLGLGQKYDCDKSYSRVTNFLLSEHFLI